MGHTITRTKGGASIRATGKDAQILFDLMTSKKPPFDKIAAVATTAPAPIDVGTLTKDQRSVLVYAETCLVDNSGLMVGARLNAADHENLSAFQAAGALTYGRIPHKLIKVDSENYPATHWVTFAEPAWVAVAALRRLRADQIGPHRAAINAMIAED